MNPTCSWRFCNGTSHKFDLLFSLLSVFSPIFLPIFHLPPFQPLSSLPFLPLSDYAPTWNNHRCTHSMGKGPYLSLYNESDEDKTQFKWAICRFKIPLSVIFRLFFFLIFHSLGSLFQWCSELGREHSSALRLY